MSRALDIPQLVSLDEAALTLGITPADVADPIRHVRDLIRRHAVPFVRVGRNVKLRPDQLRALAERMIECRSSSTSTTMASGTFPAPSPSGETDNLIQLRFDARPAAGTKHKQAASSAKSKVRSPSKISPVANPLSRSAKQRRGT